MANQIAKGVLIPSVAVLGLNAGIEYMVTGSLKGTPAFGFQMQDGVALVAQLAVSGAAYAVSGPIPAVLGVLEAVVFAGLKLMATPSLPLAPFKPPTASPTSSIPGASALVSAAKSIPGASDFLKKFGIAGTVTQQMN